MTDYLLCLQLAVTNLEPDRISVRSRRPTSPSKQSVDRVVFESQLSPDTVPGQVMPPQRPTRKSMESTENKVLYCIQDNSILTLYA